MHFIPDYTLEELTEFLGELGERPFRARQIYNWVFRKYSADFTEMTNISEELQKKLKKTAHLSGLKVIKESFSPESGTKKFLFELYDGNYIETVFMPDGTRRTICISSQVGCALGCLFCATGLMGFKRNLSTGEIVDQVLSVTRITGEKPTNIVFMGMGEPFHNYDNVIKAANILSDERGLGIGARHITVSTAGLGDKIERYLKEKHKFKLAISLNAAVEETRRSIMPVSKAYPIRKIVSTIKEFHKKKSRPVTFEYVLMKDVNDSLEEIDILISIVNKLPVKVNLIPHNPVVEEFYAPEATRVEEIFQKLRKAGIQVNVRWSKGTDIDAACGQLYSKLAR